MATCRIDVKNPVYVKSITIGNFPKDMKGLVKIDINTYLKKIR